MLPKMRKIFKFTKGEIIDGTEEIHSIIHEMIIPEKLNTSRCPRDIEITITKRYLNNKNLKGGYKNGNNLK